MPTPNHLRDYKQEYRDYHGKPKQIKERASRGKARKKMGLRVGDKREVDHKDGNPRNNSRKNLKIMSRRGNRAKA